MKFLAFLVALGTAQVAFAEATDTVVFTNTASTNKYNVLEGVALTSAVSARTATFALSRRMSTLKVNLFYTYSAAGAVTVAFACSIDGTNYATPQKRNLTTGTFEDLADSRTVSASFSAQLYFSVAGCSSAKVVVGSTGEPDGDDLINLQAVAVVGE